MEYAGSSEELSDYESNLKMGMQKFENEYRKKRRQFKLIAKIITFGNIFMMLWLMMDLNQAEFAIFIY